MPPPFPHDMSPVGFRAQRRPHLRSYQPVASMPSAKYKDMLSPMGWAGLAFHRNRYFARTPEHEEPFLLYGDAVSYE
jgi:hypothetical protein